MSGPAPHSSPLRSCARSLERVLHGVWRPLTAAIGLRKPRSIEAYRSHGNDEAIWIRGRVLGNEQEEPAQSSDGAWQHLQRSCRRWLTFEVPHARVTVRFEAQEQEVQADSDGYFEAHFAREPSQGPTRWAQAESRVAETDTSNTHDVLLPGDNARLLIITDVDDTVIHTGATQLRTITCLTFLAGVHERKTLEGVQELYQSLVGEDGANPLFYVSSSAWNLYGMIGQILELGGLPRGPLLLQRLGLANNRFVQEPGHRHKLEKIELLLATYPGLQAVLIGDSGQHDARLYVDAARRNPGRIRAILIRDVEATGQRSGNVGEIEAALAEAAELGVPMRRCGTSADLEGARVEFELG